jgi:hypothetical protein
MRRDEMRMQRDQALVCLILSGSIALATLLSVFGKLDRLAVESARKEVAIHEDLLRETSKAQIRSQEALDSVNAALASIRSAPRR